jgi:site-specific DNA recombinase
MLLGFLRALLTDPKKIDEMIQTYAKATSSELPGIEGRIKITRTEIRQTEKKIENLISRLSELPKEISAEPIYRQLKLLNEKLTLLKESCRQLEVNRARSASHAADADGLKNRIREAIERLETAPVAKQRPIFANVIDFAELHPTKVRLGLYAPLMPAGSTSVHKSARRETRTLTGFPIRS